MIQVDHHGFEYIDQGGERRYLACLKDSAVAAMRCATYSLQDVPPSDYRELSLLPRAMVRILNQKSTSACVGHMEAGAFETAWKLKNAAPHPFSAFFVYAQINGGRDAGAMIADALEAGMKIGHATEAEVPADGSVKFTRQIPSGVYEVGKRFKIAKGERLRTSREIYSSLQLGFVVCLGIDCGRAFDTDAEGYIYPQRGGGGGHGVYLMGMKQRNGDWYGEMPNSWGSSFGIGGVGYLHPSYFDGNADAYRIEVAGEDPQETELPPIAKE